MAWRSGSLSRSLISTARSSLRPAAPSPLPRLRPSPLGAPRLQSRRFSMPASRITFTSAQYDGYHLHDVTHCCQCARLLRAVPWEEWKRWVMRKDIDHPMARQECCIVREEAVGFA